MAKKVIQVPIDEELLNALDRWSQKRANPALMSFARPAGAI